MNDRSPRDYGVGKAKRAHAQAAAIFLALVFSPGTHAQTAACHAPQEPRQVAELLFGRKIGDRLAVSAAQWGRFVDREISPRFPDGLTIFDTQGEWRDTTRKATVHEPSKVVEIVLPGKGDDLERLEQIAEAYKTRFRQQSVGIIVREACVSF
ncbi:MAG TPA: DUF3574 domain-containing protein [Xanthobacteraceae bacterium]